MAIIYFGNYIAKFYIEILVLSSGQHFSRLRKSITRNGGQSMRGFTTIVEIFFRKYNGSQRHCDFVLKQFFCRPELRISLVENTMDHNAIVVLCLRGSFAIVFSKHNAIVFLKHNETALCF